jgi:hypothetical protein
LVPADPENPRGLRWDRGGWLGSQLGGSCWIGAAALLTLPRDVGVGLVVLVLFAAANLVGLLLWRRREQLSPYAGIQLLLTVLGLFGASAIYVLDRAGLFEQIQVGGQVSAGTTYLVLAGVIGLLMLFFRLRFAPSRRDAQR